MSNPSKFQRRAALKLAWLVTACGGTSPPPATSPRPNAIRQAPYGSVDGTPVSLYTLTNARGLVLKVTDYGTIITELHVPDKAGKFADIVLGFDSLEGYQKQSPYFGAT